MIVFEKKSNYSSSPSYQYDIKYPRWSQGIATKRCHPPRLKTSQHSYP